MPNVFLDSCPYTEEGAKLQLTAEQEEKCRVVYRLDDKGGAVFSELWNPEKEYSDEYVIVPLRSSFKGVTKTKFKAGKEFANVEGSSGDPRPAGFKSWIEILRSNGITTCTCCATNAIYDPNTNKSIDDDVWYYDNGQPTKAPFKCNTRMVGGHVLIGSKNSASVFPGSPVHLLPICDCHNITQVTESGHFGAGYYMKLGRNTQAVELANYLEKV